MSHCRSGGRSNCHPHNAAVFTAAAAARRHHQQQVTSHHHAASHHSHPTSHSTTTNYNPGLFSEPVIKVEVEHHDQQHDIEKNMVSFELATAPKTRRKFGCC